jgi:hypothetical protein
MPSRDDDDAPVTLVSSDGFEFVVDADAARVSNTVKHMLASEGVGGQGGRLWGAAWAREQGQGRGEPGRAPHRVETPHRAAPSPTLATRSLSPPPPHTRHPLPPIIHAGGFTEAEARRVTFPEIPGVVLERVCQYFYYKLQYNDA